MAPNNSDAELPDMSDVFKSHPRPEVKHALLADYRTTARNHLQQTIPDKITHLRTLIASESDPSSPLWLGHLESEAYIKPSILQPDDPRVTEMGIKPVMPDQVGDTQADDDMSTLTSGVKDLGQKSSPTGQPRTGAHWFEVLPRLDVQDELINLSIKEFEAMATMIKDLQVWIELETPVIEDGNSFGADVQHQLVRDMNEYVRRTIAYQNGCRQHYDDRLRLAKEWCKYPNLKDYPAAFAVSARADHFYARSYLRSLLTMYGSLITRFERNWEKVINPKGSGGSGGAMY